MYKSDSFILKYEICFNMMISDMLTTLNYIHNKCRCRVIKCKYSTATHWVFIGLSDKCQGAKSYNEEWFIHHWGPHAVGQHRAMDLDYKWLSLNTSPKNLQDQTTALQVIVWTLFCASKSVSEPRPCSAPLEMTFHHPLKQFSPFPFIF